ncbi:MAG: hypothetical protein HY211_03470 [Candidatus Omnitrophica bacterium]|nr:hypothetical protein [Candidatus Omnitrophota bacterium]
MGLRSSPPATGNSANVSISSDTRTAIPFSSERWDNGDLHDTVVNTTRLTAKSAGKYLIFGMVYWWPSDLGRRELGIQLNTGSFLAMVLDRGINESNLGSVQSITTFYDLQAGDYVELQVKQNSGGSLSISIPEFGMEKIS